MSKNWRFFILGSILSASSLGTMSVSFANETAQDANEIKAAVDQAITQNLAAYPYVNLNVSVRSLDKRLRLKDCTEELQTTVRNPSQRLGRITTEVSCLGQNPWKIYVQATASAEMEVPVLVRPISRGEIVSTDDLELRLVALGQEQQPIAESLESLVGMEARRTLAPGQPIVLSQVIAPDVIKRGQAVSIRYDESDLRITMSGKALQNGAKGEWIAVENSSSGRQIEGRVTRDGFIVIPSL